MPVGDLGKKSLRISKHWHVDMCEGERTGKDQDPKSPMTRFLQVVFACKKAAGMMQGCCWQFPKF